MTYRGCACHIRKHTYQCAVILNMHMHCTCHTDTRSSTRKQCAARRFGHTYSCACTNMHFAVCDAVCATRPESRVCQTHVGSYCRAEIAGPIDVSVVRVRVSHCAIGIAHLGHHFSLLTNLVNTPDSLVSRTAVRPYSCTYAR